MTKARTRKAIAAAKRFIELAQAAIIANTPRDLADGPVSDWMTDAPKEQGAARRASMDLTRELAEWRKP